MDVFKYGFIHIFENIVAWVPLIMVFVLLKKFKLSANKTILCLILNLLVNVYFWLRLEDFYIVLNHGVSYIASFLWLWAENVLEKRQADNKNSDDLL